MKRFLVLLLVVLLGSCNPFPNSFYGVPWDHRDTGLEFSSVEELSSWMCMNLRYVSDLSNYGQEEYWASPYETLERRSGDCEDMVIFAIYHLQKLGYTAVMVSGSLLNGEGHAALGLHGAYVEGQLNTTVYFTEIWCVYTYEQIIDTAEKAKRGR